MATSSHQHDLAQLLQTTSTLLQLQTELELLALYTQLLTDALHQSAAAHKAVHLSKALNSSAFKAIQTKDRKWVSSRKSATCSSTAQPSRSHPSLQLLSGNDALRAIKRWLTRRNIVLIDAKFDLPNKALRKSSRTIGKWYSDIAPLLHKIKRTISAQESMLHFSITDIQHPHPEKIWERTRRTCDQWVNYKLIQRNSLKNPPCIYITIPSDPAIRHFFLGQWLELFIIETVLHILRAYPISLPIAWARNVQIAFGNPGRNVQRREIDFFLLIGNKAFCFEAKTGEQKNILRFRETCAQLALPFQRIFLVAADPNFDDQTCRELSNKHQLIVCTPATFEQYFTNVLTIVQRHAFRRSHTVSSTT